MNERGFGFVLGWLSCTGVYFVAYSYQAFKKFIDQYDVLIVKKDLDGEQ